MDERCTTVLDVIYEWSCCVVHWTGINLREVLCILKLIMYRVERFYPSVEITESVPIYLASARNGKCIKLYLYVRRQLELNIHPRVSSSRRVCRS